VLCKIGDGMNGRLTYILLKDRRVPLIGPRQAPQILAPPGPRIDWAVHEQRNKALSPVRWVGRSDRHGVHTHILEGSKPARKSTLN
jgi:hypothetical protein